MAKTSWCFVAWTGDLSLPARPCQPLTFSRPRYWFTTGVTRAVKKGVASMQEDWRTTVTMPHRTVLQQITAGRATPQVFVFRQILSSPTTPSFASLVQTLADVPLAAHYAPASATQNSPIWQRGRSKLRCHFCSVDQLLYDIVLEKTEKKSLMRGSGRCRSKWRLVVAEKGQL